MVAYQIGQSVSPSDRGRREFPDLKDVTHGRIVKFTPDDSIIMVDWDPPSGEDRRSFLDWAMLSEEIQLLGGPW